MQSPAARRRRRLAVGLVVAGMVTIAAPVLVASVAPGIGWAAWIARSLPTILIVAGIVVWYRADSVFDRGFDPDQRSHGDDDGDAPHAR
ncbi:hypothetical protein [Frigoribacterium faeni]|uniref:hypothetical protein n=1 Tax=Frigoribacterium faeni TaxID=145483 RepID=UPI00141AC6E8|nr:hypothetical protein [Frigoribacterium faeni]NIJ05697.1 hypothetical protein [Frigoribacterium faeni]